MGYFDINNKQIKMCLVLRLSQAQRGHLKSMTYDELEAIFERFIWRHQKPQSLHEAVSDVFKQSDDQLTGYLAKITEIDSYQKAIEDYKDVFANDED